jgi:hypothetical protein
LLVGCLVAAPLLVVRWIETPDPLPGFPTIILWAWESRQDLSFLKRDSAGIAFLARTVWVDGDRRVQSRPRLQPLRFTPGTALMAVVRVESAGHGLPSASEVVREIRPAAELAGVRALQIDFDARQSEREWYGALLRQLHDEMPPKIPLTITALEHWCEDGAWVSSLPVTEATPMLFRMGPEDRRTPGSFAAGPCSSSVGVSTDELPVRIPRARRIYFFHPGPWTQQAYDAAVAQAARWRK